MRHVLRCLMLCSGLAAAGVAGAAEPPPLMRVPQAERPVRLVAAAIKAEVAGTLATTRIDLVFLNENKRPLEGELQFPLADGQTVTGFALEATDGSLLPAVAVRKDRGQEVFEAVERRQVDPALLERTAGNGYRLRVYPLPAGKTRRVRLELSELLRPDRNGQVRYTWPLRFPTGGPVHLNFEAALHGIAADQVVLPAGLKEARVADRQGDAVVWLDQPDYRGGLQAGPAWTPPGRATVFSDRIEGETYFHVELPVAAQGMPRPAPRRLSLVWDASGSGAARDHAGELALLEAYFKAVGDLQVGLVVVRDRAEPVREFTVRSGAWRELRRALEQVAYDGASAPAAWLPAAGADLALLFSDGLGNWGAGRAARPAMPLFAVNGAAAANPDRLRSLAEASGGAYLDLRAMTTAEALAELTSLRPVFHTAHVMGVEDLAIPSIHPRQGRLRLAGRLTGGEGVLNVSLKLPDGRFQHSQVRIPAASGPERAVAARLWAGYRIADLEADADRHRAEIERLALRFGLVSSQTSLLVLEGLDDYLRYRVLPPAGPMREAYLARAAGEAADSPARRSRHLDDLARRFAEMVRWWERDFPKGKPPAPVSPDRPEAALEMARAERDGHARAVRRAPAPAGMPHPAPVALAQAAATIQLQAWRPDAPYARRLREAGAADRYAIYLDERPGHADSPAFYLDAADVLFAGGQAELAVRVLSNLAEMDLENRHLLRILAYRLQQAGQPGLALPLLRRVRDLAPEEPQSWRDLGLALAADGQHQAALEVLWETVSRPWDDRFADIDLIALAELNALIARHPGLDAAFVDRRLLRNLPLDLRVVLGWDSDNTDMDLWVIDPNGEKTYYGQPLSYQGGRLSRDFTAGYGPEAFSLKAAKPGRYEVRVQFYGHRRQVLSPYTTVMLRLSTDFGRPGQKDEEIVLRLAEAKDDVLVGSFEVGARP